MVAGHINAVRKWKELTCDSAVLSAVAGYKIELIIYPEQITKSNPIKMSPQEAYHVDSQIDKFLQKGIIVASSQALRPKKDGSLNDIKSQRAQQIYTTILKWNLFIRALSSCNRVLQYNLQ